MGFPLKIDFTQISLGPCETAVPIITFLLVKYHADQCVGWLKVPTNYWHIMLFTVYILFLLLLCTERLVYLVME